MTEYILYKLYLYITCAIIHIISEKKDGGYINNTLLTIFFCIKYQLHAIKFNTAVKIQLLQSLSLSFPAALVR